MAHDILQPTSQKSMTLPRLVFGPVEVRRLLRELEGLDEYFAQDRLRGKKQTLPPTASRLLNSLASENHVNLLSTPERQVLIGFLDGILKEAPQLHVSFAADPSSAFMVKMVGWFRENIHPHTLLQLGLQPSIAAGCVLRTPNRMFDFSLAHHFKEERHRLIEAIGGEQAR